MLLRSHVCEVISGLVGNLSRWGAMTAPLVRNQASIDKIHVGPRSIAGKLQFSGKCDSGRSTGKDNEAIEVHEAQIAFILRQAEEGTMVGEVCRKAGVSQAAEDVRLTPSKMRRLRQLEEENGKLKKVIADLSLDTRCCRM